MIVYNDKPVIIADIDRSGERATIHYVEALGTSESVAIEDLRADTMEELEDELNRAVAHASARRYHEVA